MRWGRNCQCGCGVEVSLLFPVPSRGPHRSWTWSGFPKWCCPRNESDTTPPYRVEERPSGASSSRCRTCSNNNPEEKTNYRCLREINRSSNNSSNTILAYFAPQEQQNQRLWYATVPISAFLLNYTCVCLQVACNLETHTHTHTHTRHSIPSSKQ